MTKLVNKIDVKVKEATSLYTRKKQLEAELEEVSEQLNLLLRGSLPGIMASNGIQVGSKTKFENFEIELKPFKDVKVLDQNLFYTWLESNHYGDIIKEELKANLRYFENKEKVKTELEKMGLVYEINRSIHFQTLKSFAKEVDLQSMPKAGVEVTDGVIATIK